ncbi:hypothetical protein SAMN04487905_101479 [Actinopolyspora xinjiangensis]|uniref:Uncharacterized protein n=1 Tax=Actinopolyspora xinjiangensis TaxID=405564 RepID=A0A1H0PBR3_9ACTN|nr:hypothetical protein [Actinopolyspora xinjiangensis]SDP02434.1 hypothetical protein SAMN04487905_101479 [Actinopolyspora xinjiangensis]
MSDPLLVPILLAALAILLALWPQHPESAPRPRTRHGGAGRGTLTVQQLRAQLAGAAGDPSGSTGTELRAAVTASATIGSSGLPEPGAVVPTQSRSEPEPIRWPETDPDAPGGRPPREPRPPRRSDERELPAAPKTTPTPTPSASEVRPNSAALAAWQAASRHTAPRGTAARRAPGLHHHTSRCQPAPATVGALPEPDPTLALMGRVLEGLRRIQ